MNEKDIEIIIKKYDSELWYSSDVARFIAQKINCEWYYREKDKHAVVIER